MPKNKADLIKYGEHLDAMKGFLADEEKFKGFINKFITETADDKRKTKEVNDAKVATYNTLLGKFTELNTMVATIEEMIYGISVDALLQKV
ncbi:hypothetical protein KAZ93_00190 [Patescibacteria group bacterium]|nr:hypothetical protein [Patescibacteria group bacterium]